MQNGAKALLSIISAGQGLLVKMLVTLGLHGSFCLSKGLLHGMGN